MSRVKEFSNRFHVTTTIHGFLDLHTASERFWRIFWICILILAFVGVIYQVVQVIRTYIGSPMITTYEIKSAQTLPFPKIEICFTNIINVSKVIEAQLHPVVVSIALAWLPNFNRDAVFAYINPDSERGFSYELYLQYIVATNPDKHKALNLLKSTLAESNQNNTDSVVQATYGRISFALEFSYRLFLASVAGKVPHLTPVEIFAAANATIPPRMAKILAASGKKIETLSLVQKAVILKLVAEVAWDQGVRGKDFATYKKKGYHKDPETFLSSLGFDQDKVLLSCHYRTEPVKCETYAKPVFDQTFGRCFLVDMETEQGVGGLGLTALVDTHTELGWPYFPSAGDGVSIRVQHEFNPVSYRTLHVPSGTLATVLLRGTHYKLKNIIKTSCQNDMEREVLTFPYSDLVCRLECYARVVVNKCGCLVPIPSKFLKHPEKTRFCSTPKESRCIFQLATVTSSIRACSRNCLPKCEYWEHDPVVTYKRFPSSALKHYATSRGVNSSRWAGNLVLLSITFEELQYNEILQSPSKTPDQLISEIGGCLGLFLGASLLSIVQVFALCAHGLIRCGGPRTAPMKDAEDGMKAPNPTKENLYQNEELKPPPKIAIPPGAESYTYNDF